MARTADDVAARARAGRTAIFFGLQNCSCIEDDIGLVEILHDARACASCSSPTTTSRCSASGCYEAEDSGITRMGREVIAR